MLNMRLPGSLHAVVVAGVPVQALVAVLCRTSISISVHARPWLVQALLLDCNSGKQLRGHRSLP